MDASSARHLRGRSLGVLALLAAGLGHRDALAQSAQERSLADSLYREGKRLLAADKVSEACRKFEESYRLDKTGGTLINLADCHEREGKLATAYGEFQGALELAQQSKRPERVKYAEKKLAALEPLLPKLTLVMQKRPEGVTISIDGANVGSGALGSSLPVDPGRHVIRVSAPKHEPFEEVVQISRPAEVKRVDIPALVPAREPTVEPPKPSTDGAWRWPLGFTVLGLGVATAGAGAGFGAWALELGRAARAGCPGGACSTDADFAAFQTGRTAATLSNALVFGGAGLGLVGVVVLATAPRDQAPWKKPAPAKTGQARLTSVAPVANEHGAGLSFAGVW
jgi:hypothetical protein